MKLQYLAAASITTLLATSCGECCTESQDALTSSSVAIGASDVSATPRAAGPEAAFISAMKGLKARKVSQFLSAVAPSSALEEMKSGWEKKRKDKVTAQEEQGFQEFMGMLTADGAEERLFMMAQPQLAKAQQQLGMLAAMAPMMAAGAIEESGAPADTMALLEPLSAKLTMLDIGSEEKCKEAIGILCTTARSMGLESVSDVQKLDFDGLMAKADLGYGLVMNVLGVYGLSFDEAIESMQAKTLSVKDGRAQMEVTMTLFGQKATPIPFEMVQDADGRWTMPERETEEAPRKVEVAQPGIAR